MLILVNNSYFLLTKPASLLNPAIVPSSRLVNSGLSFKASNIFISTKERLKSSFFFLLSTNSKSFKLVRIKDTLSNRYLLSFNLSTAVFNIFLKDFLF